MTKAAFVTGATGLLGRSLVKEVIARKYAVTALVRRPAAARLLPGEVDHVRCDLREAAAFGDRLADAEVLVHAGACYGEFYRTGREASFTETMAHTVQWFRSQHPDQVKP